jgi:hypothetical protein
VQSASVERFGTLKVARSRDSTSSSGITIPLRKTSMKAPTGLAAR